MNLIKKIQILLDETRAYRFALNFFRKLSDEGSFLMVIDQALVDTYGDVNVVPTLNRVASAFRKDSSLKSVALLFRARGYRPGYVRSLGVLLPARLIDDEIAFRPAPAAVLSNHDFVPDSGDPSEEEFVTILNRKADAFVISIDQPELTAAPLQVILQAMAKAHTLETGQIQVTD